MNLTLHGASYNLGATWPSWEGVFGGVQTPYVRAPWEENGFNPISIFQQFDFASSLLSGPAILSSFDTPRVNNNSRTSANKPEPPANHENPKLYTGKYAEFINEAAKKYNVDPALIAAVIKQESAFNPRATSHCGAQGLMQLMPETAAGLGVKDAYDPRQNIMGGTRYLRAQLNRFDGNVEKTLAAYNAGPGAVEKYGGIPPYLETQDYVKRIMADYRNNC